MTYPHSSGATQFALQTTFKLSRKRNGIGVVEIDKASDTEEDGKEGADHDQTRAGGGPGVLPRREDAQQIVVLVNGLAKVSALLRVPPVGAGITELALDSRRVDVAAVLRYYQSAPLNSEKMAPTMPGSSASVSDGGAGYFSSIIFLSLYA